MKKEKRICCLSQHLDLGPDITRLKVEVVAESWGQWNVYYNKCEGVHY